MNTFRTAFLRAAYAALATFALGAQAMPGEHAHHAHPGVTAFGNPAVSDAATREVRVEMRDTMRFDPAEVTVKRGEIVRFVATNAGKVMHEMVLGTRADLEEHAAMMRKHHPGGGMHHEEPNMLHVAPGKSATMTWQFTRAGEFYYGCLEPGHWEAGMAGKVRVVD